MKNICAYSLIAASLQNVALCGHLIDFNHNKLGEKWDTDIKVSLYWNLCRINFKVPEDIANVRSALSSIENVSCLRFREVSEDNCKYDCILYARLFGEETNSCDSNVGRQKTTYNLVRGQNVCFQSPGKIIHETLHSIGFLHEHQRPDRDKYIKILWSNVKRYKNPQFTIKRVNVTTLNTKYDFSSIMHYGTTKFSKGSNLRTIEPFDDNVAHLMGQRNQLSAEDIRTINLAYCFHK